MFYAMSSFRSHMQEFRRDHSKWPNVLLHSMTVACSYYFGVVLCTRAHPLLGRTLVLGLNATVLFADAPLLTKLVCVPYVGLATASACATADAVPLAVAVPAFVGAAVMQRLAHELTGQPSTLWQLDSASDRFAHVVLLPLTVIQLLLEKLGLTPQLTDS